MVFEPLVVGNLTAKFPLIQGGMGVGVSLSNLAGAVAKEGAIGIISAAQIGYKDELFEKKPLQANLAALKYHLVHAKENAEGGIIGVNIMVALANYEEYVKCSVENGADLIISGAGLPLHLPALVQNSSTKIAPIVSSLKACRIVLGIWEKRYQTTADLIIVEGPKAGGHLGFKREYFNTESDFDEELKKIIALVQEFAERFKRTIPVVFAGGVFDQKDIEHYLSLGCQGVQMGSRFVVCDECDADENFKQAYIQAEKSDIGLINSPVGMIGRALTNSFIKETQNNKKIEVKKCYLCLAGCDKKNIPYCITEALINAAKGDMDHGLLFCGESVYRIHERTTVKELLQELFN